jgi:nitrous oxidase accessory protein NosD
VKYSYLAGASGGAVHLYHAPGAQQVRVQNNTIRDSYWGVIADSGSSVEVSYNTFVNNTTNIRRTGGATVTAFGNSPNDTIN